MKVPADIREALTALMAEYAMAIDDNRLEDWVELFDEACDYKVMMRENVEQNLPNVLMWCDNKNMLRDRIESYRQVNLYNLHYDRHVLGPLHFTGHDGPLWRVVSFCPERDTLVPGRICHYMIWCLVPIL